MAARRNHAQGDGARRVTDRQVLLAQIEANTQVRLAWAGWIGGAICIAVLALPTGVLFYFVAKFAGQTTIVSISVAFGLAVTIVVTPSAVISMVMGVKMRAKTRELQRLRSRCSELEKERSDLAEQLERCQKRPVHVRHGGTGGTP